MFKNGIVLLAWFNNLSDSSSDLTDGRGYLYPENVIDSAIVDFSSGSISPVQLCLALETACGDCPGSTAAHLDGQCKSSRTSELHTMTLTSRALSDFFLVLV